MSVTYWTRNNQDIRYYDYLLERYNVVDLNMLFLIGYSAGLPHSHVSDHIWIPSTIQDKNGDELIVDKQMFDKAHRYLDDKWRIDLTKDGLSFDIWALRFLFDDLGFTTKKGGKIPMFMRSSDYDPVDLKDITSFTPPERLPGESVSDYERRYDADYRTWVAQTKNVNYTARYQLSEGFLYGLANAGYGTLPFTRIDTGWYTGDSNLIDLLQSALDTLHNPLYRGREDLQGRNLFYNWENSDPVPVIGTVGSVSPETERGSLVTGVIWLESTKSLDTLTCTVMRIFRLILGPLMSPLHFSCTQGDLYPMCMCPRLSSQGSKIGISWETIKSRLVWTSRDFLFR